MKQHLLRLRIAPAALLVTLTMLFGPASHAQELAQVLRGYEITPVKLDLRGKDWWLVGLGSYIVNTTGCNDCHTHPNWADGGNPFMGQPEQINTAQYMSADGCLGRQHRPILPPIEPGSLPD